MTYYAIVKTLRYLSKFSWSPQSYQSKCRQIDHCCHFSP